MHRAKQGSRETQRAHVIVIRGGTRSIDNRRLLVRKPGQYRVRFKRTHNLPHMPGAVQRLPVGSCFHPLAVEVCRGMHFGDEDGRLSTCTTVMTATGQLSCNCNCGMADGLIRKHF